MMRALMLISTAACAVAAPPEASVSMHDRLTDGIRFAIHGTGSVTAEHRAPGDTWVGGGASITIGSGELAVRLENEALVAEPFDVSLEPIELPEVVFGQPSSLTGVRLTGSSSSAEPTWTSGTATATFQLDLDLAWSIAIAGGSTSLGVQHLPTISMDVELTGSGSAVDATLELQGVGELWSWASLIRLGDLALDLAATSRFE